MMELSPTAAEMIARIRAILASARNQAMQSVNAAMVRAYWEIGREIVEEEQRGQARAEYGQQLIATLSDRLSAEFGRGFNERNLRFMREFYSAFPKWNAVRSELSWTHYLYFSLTLGRLVNGVSVGGSEIVSIDAENAPSCARQPAISVAAGRYAGGEYGRKAAWRRAMPG